MNNKMNNPYLPFDNLVWAKCSKTNALLAEHIIKMMGDHVKVAIAYQIYGQNGLEWTCLEWTFGPKPPQRFRVDFLKKWKFYKLFYALNPILACLLW